MQKYDLGEIYEILDKNIFVVQVTLAQTCLAETPQAREYAQYMLIFLTKLRLGMLINVMLIKKRTCTAKAKGLIAKGNSQKVEN